MHARYKKILLRLITNKEIDFSYYISLAQILLLSLIRVIRSINPENFVNIKKTFDAFSTTYINLGYTLDDAEKLNMALILLDLQSMFSSIMHRICNSNKFVLVRRVNSKDKQYSFLKVVCDHKNIEPRKEAHAAYDLQIKELQVCMNKVNEILSSLPYPKNPDGVWWTIDNVAEALGYHAKTMDKYRDQSQLMQQQKEEYLLYREQYRQSGVFPEHPSNATLAQRKFYQVMPQEKFENNEVTNIAIKTFKAFKKCFEEKKHLSSMQNPEQESIRRAQLSTFLWSRYGLKRTHSESTISAQLSRKAAQVENNSPIRRTNSMILLG